MNQTQRQLVQQTFAKIEPIAETAAQMFYSRLFTLAPEVRPLFKGEMDEQGRKLMSTLALAVRSLDRLEQLRPVLEQLGRRHAAWGVRDEQYDVVAAALLWTLGQALGPEWTLEVQQSWIAVYGALAGAMKQGAAAAPRTLELAS